ADLIKDYYAAVIELVKNAYDADSDKVLITLSLVTEKFYGIDEEYLKFTIEDTGEGMSFETIKNAWMVPATSYKLNKKVSTSKKRLYQGRKGIGRYASAVLGDYLRMTTTDVKGDTVIIDIDWKEFESKDDIKYLDEINIKYSHEQKNLDHGTKIEIFSHILKEYDEDTDHTIVHLAWSEEDRKNLLKELRNLLSPLEKDLEEDKFEIHLEYKGLEDYGFNDNNINIEPFPLLELYDYRISGQIDSSGAGLLFYENQNFTDSNENVNINVRISTDEKPCGELDIDLRFFDLDPEAIIDLINRGLKDPTTNEYLSRSEARDKIKEYAGIGIYRNLFRIRPYGDSNYDWLELNQKRVNNPTAKFSTNQVVGFINISSEEESGLIEKSAREGLKENSSYETLRTIMSSVISKVESRRYQFRKNTKRGRKAVNNVQEAISNLFNFDNVSYKVKTLLEKSGLDNTIILDVEKTIKDEEKSKEKELKNIQETLVMYEAHAALGRLVQLVIHEGRKPIQFSRDNLKNLERNINYFIETPNDLEIKSDILNFIAQYRNHLETISKLFSNLDPLTAKRLTKKKKFDICQNMQKNLDFFKNQFKKYNINVDLLCSENILYYGREEDFFILYANLIENSIYWFKTIDIPSKLINVHIYRNEEHIIIDYRDNGPGFEDKFANDIFDAGFSTKPEGGTGIGLTLAGQAMSRNNGRIECIKSDNGVFFKIDLNTKEIE
ncbi:MAG TPA: sensor histidine kinase, partial [Bacteroidia bacterium]|nr:sensor histidine kinase [Bacteroidia bacterium]